MTAMFRAATVATALVLISLPSAGQVDPRWDPTGLQLTRAELEDILTRYDASIASGAYSNALRNQAEREAALIRSRLEEGDMRVGDRVLLAVESHEQLSDTFNVVAGRMLVLPEIGRIPLDGVLRSELQAHLTSHIARYIREPIVQVRALVRLEIAGAVLRPGFYPVPSDMLITDVLMLAGGPVPQARIEGIEIRRGTETIWEAAALRPAVIEGRTLDQLSVRAGDGIYVPQRGARAASLQSILVIVTGVASLALLAAQIGVF